ARERVGRVDRRGDLAAQRQPASTARRRRPVREDEARGIGEGAVEEDAAGARFAGLLPQHGVGGTERSGVHELCRDPTGDATASIADLQAHARESPCGEIVPRRPVACSPRDPREHLALDEADRQSAHHSSRTAAQRRFDQRALPPPPPLRHRSLRVSTARLPCTRRARARATARQRANASPRSAPASTSHAALTRKRISATPLARASPIPAGPTSAERASCKVTTIISASDATLTPSSTALASRDRRTIGSSGPLAATNTKAGRKI